MIFIEIRVNSNFDKTKDKIKRKKKMLFAMPTFVKNVDMFGAPIHNFNLSGRAEVKTTCGACISMIIFTLTFMFALLRLGHLQIRKNPLIAMHSNPLEEGERFNMDSEDFMMAFGVLGKYSTPKNDTRYLRW